jgi:adenylylsulfate kinase-like enzyme
VAQRQAARESCEKAGITFLEVFVNAPIEVCEQRDPRGLYRKARAGQIPQFTGIASPYEPPTNPDIELRTDLFPMETCLFTLAAKVHEASKL